MFKILDMDKLMQPKIDEERKKIVDAAREEALENAIALVKQKIREQMELEQQAKEEAGKASALFQVEMTLFKIYFLSPFIVLYLHYKIESSVDLPHDITVKVQK